MGSREAAYNIPSVVDIQGVSASRKLHNQVGQASSQPLRVLLAPEHFRNRRRDASGLRDKPADCPRVELLSGASFAKGFQTDSFREPSHAKFPWSSSWAWDRSVAHDFTVILQRTQEGHGEIGCGNKDDRGERAGRSEPVRQLDGRHDLRADSERENRAEAGNFSTCFREARGGDRAVPSELGEQVGQQEPHGEATRDSHQSGCGHKSQLRASRMVLSSRRDLPKLPLPVETEASTPVLDAGVETGKTTPVAETSMCSPADVRRGLRR